MKKKFIDMTISELRNLCKWHIDCDNCQIGGDRCPLDTNRLFESYVEDIEIELQSQTSEDWQSFFNLTKQMRKLQKQYFKTRSYKALEESKQLESAVDKAIKTIEAAQVEHSAEPKQPNLFGDSYD